MAEAAGPALTAETIREIFLVASASIARGVLFAVRETSAEGIAQYGLPNGDVPPSQRVRQASFKLEEYSLIATVVEDRELFRGEPDHVRANTALIKALGGPWPTDSVVIPMLIGDRVGLVFYGDNQPKDASVGPTEDLERIIKAVGRRLAEAKS
jgi:hypothetical protein